MSSITAPDRFTTLPDERVPASTVTVLGKVLEIRQAVGF